MPFQPIIQSINRTYKTVFQLVPLVIFPFVIAFCILAQTTSIAHAQTTDPHTIELVGHFGGQTNAVFIDGTIAYTGQGPRLIVWDVSDPADPVLIGRSDPLPDMIVDIDVVENVAYIASERNGLATIDLTDLSNPVILNTSTLNDAVGVVVRETIAYVADSYNGLFIFDVSDPSNPNQAGSFTELESPRAIDVIGNFVYIVGVDDGLVIFDVSDLTNPIRLGSSSGISHPTGMVVIDNFAYVTENYSGLLIFNVTDPTNPRLIAIEDTRGVPRAIAVKDGTAYISQWSGLTAIIDVSDPTDPTFLNTVTTGNGTDVMVQDDVVYIAGWSKGLMTVDVSDPTTPLLLGQAVNIVDSIIDVYVAEEIAYIVSRAKGLVIVDVEVPSNPTLLSSIPLSTHELFGGRVIVDGNIAYVLLEIVSGDDKLYIIDVSNREQPVLLTTVDSDNVGDMVVIDHIVYLAHDMEGLTTIDVSDPFNPVFLDSLNMMRYTEDVVVADGTAFVTVTVIDENSTYELLIVDVSDPTNINLIQSIQPINRGYSVVAEENIVYVGGGYEIMRLDANDPTYTTQTIYSGWSSRLFVDSGIIYIAEGSSWGSVSMVDVNDHANPIVLGSVGTAVGASDVYTVDNVVYVAGMSGGVYIFEHSPAPAIPTMATMSTVQVQRPSPHSYLIMWGIMCVMTTVCVGLRRSFYV